VSSQKPAIDLSQLPPAIRQQVEAGLAKLPPEARQQLLEKGSPILEKAIARAKASAAANSGHAGISGSSFETPHMQSRGHYNSTVMPGDRFSLRGWMLFAVVASGAVYLFIR